MRPEFEILSVRWFYRAFVYTGSIADSTRGIDFRYRFEQDTSDKKQPKLIVSVYSSVCFEKAEDIRQEIFPWTDEGVEVLKSFLQTCFDSYVEKCSRQAE